MPEKTWDDKYDYMRNVRQIHHNDDYLKFLVASVWELPRFRTFVDFGCGFGFLGLKLLPLLPHGCTYTGVDASRALLDKAEELYADLPYEAGFIVSEAYDTPFDDSQFDVAMCHAVLQHLKEPEMALDEMIRVTRLRSSGWSART